MRIVKTRYKLLYILVVSVFNYFLDQLLTHLDPTGISTNIHEVLAAVFFVIAVRCFRVPEEDIKAPRPWWRLTGRPTAGFWLASLWLLGTIGEAVTYFAASRPLGLTAVATVENSPVFFVINTVIGLAWGILYFNSSLRLARKDGPAVDFPVDETNG